jgi:hypothetical protein
MSFFDFFFPQEAQASHLRRIADQQELQSQQEGMQRFRDERDRRWETSRSQALEQRVEELERDLGQASLVIEALIQLLESSGTLKRDDIATRAIAIDSADGVTDGRVTPNLSRPFLPRRAWEDAAKPG